MRRRPPRAGIAAPKSRPHKYLMAAAANRLLITGGCGFIGANLIAQLQQRGSYDITVLDNETGGRREPHMQWPGRFIHGDIRDGNVVRTALDGVEAVIHLAAHTSVIESIASPVHNFDVNVRGTLTLLEAMRKLGIPRMINASTGGGLVGERAASVHEDILPRPKVPYGASKLAAEGYCMAYAGSYGIATLSLRFSNVYGPGSGHKNSAVATFFKQIAANRPVSIYGDGAQSRDFIFVEDLCDGIVSAIDSPTEGAMQIGSGVTTTVNDLLDQITEIVAPIPVERVYTDSRCGEIRHTYCDVTRARTLLGFAPKMSLAEGLRATWAWFRERYR
jgi:UDP-glucose 4-epimerase